jgi:hypothetical protein
MSFMANVTIADGTVNVEITGLDRLWAFRNRIEIPLEHVRGATFDPAAVKGWRGWRGPGTDLPGVITAGTFHKDGELIFWDVHHGDRAIVIELADEQFQRLVIEVDDPAAVVSAINQAVGGQDSSST